MPYSASSAPTTDATAAQSRTAETDGERKLPVFGDTAGAADYELPMTLVENLGVTGNAPEVDIGEYHLLVDGLVRAPLLLDYEAIKRCASISKVVVLDCPDVFIDVADWTGVPVSTLLAQVGVQSWATQLTFFALDGYQRTFSLKDVVQAEAFLAYAVNGQTLPEEHGFPLRLVMRERLGSDWVKWVNRIEVK